MAQILLGEYDEVMSSGAQFQRTVAKLMEVKKILTDAQLCASKKAFH